MAETKELKTLKEELSDLRMAVSATNKSVDRLVFILNNDEGTGRAGLVTEVRNLDKDVKELKKKWGLPPWRQSFFLPIFWR